MGERLAGSQKVAGSSPAGSMTAFICVTCGTQFPPSAEPPPGCPICLDERQYVGHDGQLWTTMVELARDHRNVVEEVEPGLLGIGPPSRRLPSASGCSW